MVVIVVAAATRRRLAVCESVMVMVAAFCQAGIDEAMPKSDSTTSIPESRPGVFAQQEGFLWWRVSASKDIFAFSSAL